MIWINKEIYEYTETDLPALHHLFIFVICYLLFLLFLYLYIQLKTLPHREIFNNVKPLDIFMNIYSIEEK